MHCGCFILDDRTPKGRKRRDIRSWWHTSDLGPRGDQSSADLIAAGYKVCQGAVKVTVTADDEPYMGGCSAVFSIDYLCDECGWTFYPHLPQSAEGISKLLTNVIGDMAADPLILEARLAEINLNNQREQMIADYKARQEAAKLKKTKKK
jgi:hypothetical protein